MSPPEVSTRPAQRHIWGTPQRDDPHLTVRTCVKCAARKLTHHEGNRHWISYASADGLAYHGEGAPKCFAANEQAAA